MKRLRLKCPFCGYGYIVFIATVTLSSVLAFIIPGVTSPGFEFHGIILRIILISFVLALIAHLWLYRTKRKERELVKNAEKIYWRELTEAEENNVRHSISPDYLGFIVAVVMIACIFFGYAYTMDFVIHPFILMITCVCAITAFIYLLSEMSGYRKWQAIDGSAKCVVLPVHHTYTVKNRAKFITTNNHYHVVYTQKGKLVFKGRTNGFGSYSPEPHVKEIRIFEYKNMLVYEEH